MIQELRDKILRYPFGSDERNFVRALIGDLTKGGEVSDQRAASHIKNAYKDTDETLNRLIEKNPRDTRIPGLMMESDVLLDIFLENDEWHDDFLESGL